MRLLEQKFSDYDAWVACAKARGYKGPTQRHGFRVYDFTSGRSVAATWNDDVGIVFGDTLPDEAA